jgi:hypothetical protein
MGTQPMKKEIEDGFAQVFRARAEAQRLASQKRQDTTSREQAFREAFRAHLERVIKPTLESLRQLLQKNGIEAMVIESEVSSGGRLTEPTIGFYAFTEDGRLASSERRPSDATVQLQLSCQAQKCKVGIYVSRPSAGGRGAGPEPDTSLEALTEQEIQRRVLALLQH